MSPKEICSTLVAGIRDYFNKNNFKKAVIGLSGGIDSSVSACLAVMALGKENVAALLMPDLGTSSEESIKDAKDLAGKLGIQKFEIPINDFIQNFLEIIQQLNISRNVHAIANAKARTRMMLLYYFANAHNALVIGTSDKSEIALGYATKFGDNAADISVIGDLWKTELIELGRYLEVPDAILSKKSSAELILGNTAEKELGASYEVLDKILKMRIEEGLSAENIIKKGFDKGIVTNVFDRIRVNEHKRKTPIILKLSEQSFHGMMNSFND